MENTKRRTSRNSKKTSRKTIGTDKNIPASTSSKAISIGLNDRLKANKMTDQNNEGSIKKITNKQTLNQSKAKISQQGIIKSKQKEGKQFNISANLRLVLATLLDTDSLQSKISNLIDLRIVQTIPAMHYLIKNYESKFGRVYTQQIRYYIISALWDHGLVEVGRADQWQQLIQYQLKNIQNQQMISPIVKIQTTRDIIINDKASKLTDKNINPKIEEKVKTIELSANLIAVFEQLEQQFYRQTLSCQHLSFSLKGQNNTNLQIDEHKILHDIFFQFFETVDKDKVGNLSLQMLISQFKIDASETSQTNKSTRFIINKFCNNLHVYDSHTRTISTPNSIGIGLIAKLLSARVSIQCFMEMLNRICLSKQHVEVNGLSTSMTYSALVNIMNMYENMKQTTIKQKQKEQSVYLKDRHYIVSIAAGIQHIRQAAKHIMQQGRLHGAQSKTQSDPLNYQTFKYKPYMVQKGNATFRNNIAEQDNNINMKQLLLIDDSKQNPQTQKFNNHHQKQKGVVNFTNKQIELGSPVVKKDQKTAQKQMASFISFESPKPVIKMETTTHPGIQTQLKQKNQSTIQHNSKIKQFVAEQQKHVPLDSAVLDRKFNPIALNQHPINIQYSNYDRLLRERIQIQLKIIELERVKNRLKYYDILGK